jgi:predicted PurR-regulated permease PerM
MSIRQYGLINLGLALALSLVAIIFHLVPALIAGLTTYTLVQGIENMLLTKLNLGKKSKLIATIFISALIVLVLIFVSMSLFSWIQTVISDPNAVVQSVQQILQKTLNDMPASFSKYIPSNVQDIQNALLEFAKVHIATFQTIGKGTAHNVITILLGMIIGVFIAYSINKDNKNSEGVEKPFTKEFFATTQNFALAFKHVAVAQVAISIFNTILTSILLLAVFPLFDINVPFVKSLIIGTFLFGLIPILGNIIVNCMVVLAALSVSIGAGAGALVFLIFIHKVEYFLNAKIVGGSVNATSYELLIVMVLAESIFGLAGLVIAPILYAFLKASLKRLDII